MAGWEAGQSVAARQTKRPSPASSVHNGTARATIEATGSGAFLLTTHHPELAKFFEPGEEIETFRTPQELAAKISYYLAMPDRADEIARRGQERCLREHSRSARASWLAEILNAAIARAGA